MGKRGYHTEQAFLLVAVLFVAALLIFLVTG